MVVSLYSKVLFHIDSERMNYKGGVFIIYLKVFCWKYTLCDYYLILYSTMKEDGRNSHLQYKKW